jgi:hypothetical protein
LRSRLRKRWQDSLVRTWRQDSFAFGSSRSASADRKGTSATGLRSSQCHANPVAPHLLGSELQGVPTPGDYPHFVGPVFHQVQHTFADEIVNLIF